jgi:SMI1-KNR4 cell-wall
MLKIPVETLSYWQRREFVPASPAELAAMNVLAKGRLPPDFLKFLADYGFVLWEYTVPNAFFYSKEELGQRIVAEAAMTYLHDVNSLGRVLEHVWMDDAANGYPMIPTHVLPIGGTGGQDMILMEMEPKNGRIWYWPFSNDAWGTPGNRTLGFVADSFTDFINNLRMGPQPYAD